MMNSVFMEEYLASPAKQTMPISSKCNISCIFCSNNNNPFKITHGIFRSIDDIKKTIPLLKPYNNTINISENIPGRIAEGESLLHPKLFKILNLIRQRFKYQEVIELSTNGTTLTEEMIKKLYAYMPIRISTLSLNSSNINHWLKICRGTKSQGQIAINASKLLKKYSIPYYASLVALPKIMGWDGIEATISYLAKNNARKITLWHPGYSNKISKAVKEQMACPFKKLSLFAINMRKKYKKPIPVLPDINIPFKVDVPSIMERTELMHKTRILWLISEAAEAKTRRMIEECAEFVYNKHFIKVVKNNTYGGNIIVSGLLMVDDFVREAKSFIEHHPKIDLIVLPQAPFDTKGKDLKYCHYKKIEKTLGRQVILA